MFGRLITTNKLKYTMEQLPEPMSFASLLTSIVSLLAVVYSIWNSTASERRAAYRQLLSTKISELGNCLFAELAECNMYVKREFNHDHWIEDAKRTAKRIKELRNELRYPLWGLAGPLKQFALVADRIQHFKNRSIDEANQYLGVADNLREVLDDAIRYSYEHGNPPSARKIRAARSATNRLSELFSAAFTSEYSRNDDEIGLDSQQD